MNGGASRTGMTARQARVTERSIIGLCILAILMIFQPYWMPLFSVGAGLVVLGGLAFNLVPLCRPGMPVRGLAKAALIVLIVFAIALAIAIGFVELYKIYLANQ